jgi:hypothetical protein
MEAKEGGRAIVSWSGFKRLGSVNFVLVRKFTKLKAIPGKLKGKNFFTVPKGKDAKSRLIE